jgi:hypothetical protein
MYNSCSSGMSGPCATVTTGTLVADFAMIGPASVLSRMTSTSASPAKARSRWRSSWAVTPIVSGSEGSKPSSRGTGEVLSADAASTTSCPASCSAQASVSMKDSIPPYAGGGIGIQGGAMMPILMWVPFGSAPQPTASARGAG